MAHFNSYLVNRISYLVSRCPHHGFTGQRYHKRRGKAKILRKKAKTLNQSGAKYRTLQRGNDALRRGFFDRSFDSAYGLAQDDRGRTLAAAAGSFRNQNAGTSWAGMMDEPFSGVVRR
jgi:hypothetical protein